jgi:Ca-activated chloride channel homolog
MKTIAFQKQQRRGAVLLLMAVLLPVLLIICGFAVNLAYMELCRTEMQIASDAGSRAACRTYARTGDENEAYTAARSVIEANKIMGKTITIQKSDLIFGTSLRSTSTSRYTFTPGDAPYNAVRVNLDAATGGGLKTPIKMNGKQTTFNAFQISAATQAELDVSLVVDRSGSMAYAANENGDSSDPPVNAPPGWDFGQPAPPKARWLDAVAAVDTFLGALEESPAREYVCLTTYNTAATNDVQLTFDYNNVRDALQVYTDAYQSGATNIGDGVGYGVNNLLSSPNKRDWAVKVLIVLTDGIHNWGPDPVPMAYYANDKEVIVYTITFSDEADQIKMEDVATIAGGIHYHATNKANLKAAFEEIARNLPVLLTE